MTAPRSASSGRIRVRRVERRSLPADVVAQLQAMIASGELAAGARLPAERELAALFGVSRGSVREALAALRALGWVDAGGRTVAHGHPADVVVGRLAPTLVAHPELLREPLEVRRVLEPEMAALAARRASDHQIAELRSWLAREAAEVAAGRIGIEEDVAFHRAIAAATDNRIFVRLYDGISELIHGSRRDSLSVAGGAARSLADHKRVLAGIAARDPRRARAAMTRHLDHVAAQVRDRIAKAGTEKPRH